MRFIDKKLLRENWRWMKTSLTLKLQWCACACVCNSVTHMFIFIGVWNRISEAPWVLWIPLPVSPMFTFCLKIAMIKLPWCNKLLSNVIAIQTALDLETSKQNYENTFVMSQGERLLFHEVNGSFFSHLFSIAQNSKQTHYILPVLKYLRLCMWFTITFENKQQ